MATVISAGGSTARAIQWGQHALFALLCAGGVIQVSIHGNWTPTLLIAVVALGTWYALGVVRAHRETTPRADSDSPRTAGWPGYAWLAGLIGLWVWAAAMASEFAWLGFAIFLLCLHLLPVPFGVTTVVLLTGFVIARQLAQSPADVSGPIIGPTVGALVALGLAWGYRAILRESRERGRLVGRLRLLTDDLVAVQESLAVSQREAGALTERARLARDIHDTLAQGFSSIVLLARAGKAAPQPQIWDQILTVAQDNLDEARRVVHALTPATLEETSLPDAIGRLVKRFGDQTGMRVRLVVDGDAAPLATVSEVALLRFVQGALANVRSHSRADQVAVTITYEADDVMVDVVDDGRGFDPATPRAPRPDGSGFGLRAMRERLAALGGRLEVESTPGDGTAIAAVLPRSTPVQEAGR